MKITATALHVSPILTAGNYFRRLITPKKWRLDHELTVLIAGEAVYVPAGTVTDFASIPRLLRVFLPDDAYISTGAVVHDYFYQQGKISKWLADALFFSILRMVDLMPWPVAAVMWIGVWLGGWPAWWGHRRKSNPPIQIQIFQKANKKPHSENRDAVNPQYRQSFH